MSGNTNTFNCGALVALGLLVALHDQPSMAADIAREMDFSKQIAKYVCSK